MLSKMHVNCEYRVTTKEKTASQSNTRSANPHWFVAMFLPLLDFHIPRAKLFSQPCSF